ncbi:hypothetical protein C2S01_01285 [Helicobacter pylori]|nr:hypothetical protein C2S01_01285 [Helicobacter pylori]
MAWPLTPPPINTQHKHKTLKIAFLKLSMTLLLLLKNLDFIIIKLQSNLAIFQNLLAIAL